ncbi:PadR family transcriptional regulator, partial [Halorubrum sp. E3]
MSEAQSVADESPTRTAADLTAFQQNILTILSEEPMYGLAIKRELESYYGSEVNHGHLYPNLDELVE